MSVRPKRFCADRLAPEPRPCWTLGFGPQIDKNLRRRQARPTGGWHVDEMVVKIWGKKRWLWRAVDDTGLVLDMLIENRCNKKAPLRLFRKLMKNTGVHPETITTDKLASYGAALRSLKLADITDVAEGEPTTGLESSDRKMQKLKSAGSAG